MWPEQAHLVSRVSVSLRIDQPLLMTENGGNVNTLEKESCTFLCLCDVATFFLEETLCG